MMIKNFLQRLARPCTTRRILLRSYKQSVFNASNRPNSENDENSQKRVKQAQIVEGAETAITDTPRDRSGGSQALVQSQKQAQIPQTAKILTPMKIKEILITSHKYIEPTDPYTKLLKKMLVTAAKDIELEFQENLKNDVFYRQAARKLSELGFRYDQLADSRFVKFSKKQFGKKLEIFYCVNIESFEEYQQKEKVRSDLEAAQGMKTGEIMLVGSDPSVDIIKNQMRANLDQELFFRKSQLEEIENSRQYFEVYVTGFN